MSNIPIFLSSDNNYAPFVATTMASICDNTKSFINFSVLDGGISEENKGKICELKAKFNNFSIEFIKIDVEKEFKGFEIMEHFTLSANSRFLIADLKPNLDKAIYLDVDIIVLGDIKELYNQNLEDYTIGAIEEKYFKENNTYFYENYDAEYEHNYFNSGVLLIHLAKWRKEKISAKLFAIEEKERTKLQYVDQDLLNIYFLNNYKILDEKFNVTTSSRRRNIKPFIRHFTTAYKPWEVPRGLEAKSFIKEIDTFRKYADMIDLDTSSYEVSPTKMRIKEMYFSKA